MINESYDAAADKYTEISTEQFSKYLPSSPTIVRAHKIYPELFKEVWEKNVIVKRKKICQSIWLAALL